MRYLVYRSTALVPRHSAASRSILTSALRNNSLNQLTGFLHREGDIFVQFLEGPNWALDQIFWTNIQGDFRHQDITVLQSGSITERVFPDWQMGYGDETLCRFDTFLQQSFNKSDIDDAGGEEAIAFLQGAAQWLDLGIEQPKP